MRYYGAVPAKGATLRMREYRTGGGSHGNVSQGALTVLRKPLAYVASVANRRHASGGVEGEDVANAKVRGPIVLRTGDRAVTAEDYEQLAHEAAPELARVACIPAENEADAGTLRVVVVPEVEAIDGRVRFEQLRPRPELLERIKRFLDERRVIGVRIAVGPPLYQGVTVVAKLRPRLGADPAMVQRRALESLYRYFGPSPEALTAPAGRSAGRFSQVRSTRCSRTCPGAKSSTPSVCSRPTRPPVCAPAPRSGSSCRRTASRSATSTAFSWRRGSGGRIQPWDDPRPSDAAPVRSGIAGALPRARNRPAHRPPARELRRAVHSRPRHGARTRVRDTRQSARVFRPGSSPRPTSSTGSPAGSGSSRPRPGRTHAAGSSSQARRASTRSAARHRGLPTWSRSSRV